MWTRLCPSPQVAELPESLPRNRNPLIVSLCPNDFNKVPRGRKDVLQHHRRLPVAVQMTEEAHTQSLLAQRSTATAITELTLTSRGPTTFDKGDCRAETGTPLFSRNLQNNDKSQMIVHRDLAAGNGGRTPHTLAEAVSLNLIASLREKLTHRVLHQATRLTVQQKSHITQNVVCIAQFGHSRKRSHVRMTHDLLLGSSGTLPGSTRVLFLDLGTAQLLERWNSVSALSTDIP